MFQKYENYLLTYEFWFVLELSYWTAVKAFEYGQSGSGWRKIPWYYYWGLEKGRFNLGHLLKHQYFFDVLMTYIKTYLIHVIEKRQVPFIYKKYIFNLRIQRLYL